MNTQERDKGMNMEIIRNINLLRKAVDGVSYMVDTGLAINIALGFLIVTLFYLNYLIKQKIDHLDLQAELITHRMNNSERKVRKHCDECNVRVKGPDPRKRFKCDVCRIETACQVSLHDHLTGKEHLMQMKQMREKGEHNENILRSVFLSFLAEENNPGYQRVGPMEIALYKDDREQKIREARRIRRGEKVEVKTLKAKLVEYHDNHRNCLRKHGRDIEDYVAYKQYFVEIIRHSAGTREEPRVQREQDEFIFKKPLPVKEHFGGRL